jgi:UDP-N-acetylglucosamine 1-carboxyvinyltransferase
MNIKVKGGQIISGEITPSGSKNSAVALIPATILFDKAVTLENIPDITDVKRLVSIMEKLGSRIKWDKEAKTMEIDNSNMSFKGLDREDLGNMKGTSLFWGPMLARFGEVGFDDLPGGCTLGFRTLEPHYKAFKDLGVRVDETDCSVKMNAKNASAVQIWLTEMSPTATENVIMLATGLKGRTKIIGAASEPQVQDLCIFLNKCGAEISGVGSSVLEIEGGKALSPVTHKLLSDHYEITTFLALAAITGGDIKINNALPGMIDNIIGVFKRFGVEVAYEGDAAIIKKNQNIVIKEDDGRGVLTVRAQPWPGLPVDTLPLFVPLALAATSGEVLFHNWMYDAGLFWTSELHKYGGNVVMCDPHRVLTIAGNELHGATIEAPYIIRAVVALTMTAMIAKGESLILNADALYRGHPDFAENLRKLGVEIEEVE